MSMRSLKSKAYDIIREKIISCKFKPGEILIESELMELVGASRTPIREALGLLEQERLVKIIPKRAMYVADITTKTVHDIYDVRCLVEPYIIEKYGGRLTESQLNHWKETLTGLKNQPDLTKNYSFDMQFHYDIIKLSDNVYYKTMMDQIYAQNSRITILTGDLLESRILNSEAEHTAILEAFEQGDTALAAVKMKEHLLMAKKCALDVLINKNTAILI